MALLYIEKKKKEKRGKRKFPWHFANSNAFLQAKCLFLYLSSKQLCKNNLPVSLERKPVLFIFFLCMRKAEKHAGPLNDVL